LITGERGGGLGTVDHELKKKKKKKVNLGLGGGERGKRGGFFHGKVLRGKNPFTKFIKIKKRCPLRATRKGKNERST